MEEKSNGSSSGTAIMGGSKGRPKSALKKAMKKVMFWSAECKYTVIIKVVKSHHWKVKGKQFCI